MLSNNPIASDQVGGHNAAYNNVQLGVPGFNPLLDPDTAAAFGLLAASYSYAGEIDQFADPSPIPASNSQQFYRVLNN